MSGPRPPELPGLTYAGVLGSGGYADVFAYDQQLPRRRVAVKVLRQASAGLASDFVAEADAMARLEHPFIVPVYAAGVAADGRPYLVMQHYPGPNLGVRSRQRPLDVEEVLRVGVQLGGAVETAHRHGLLHRDIKPANVLTSAYGTPGLTDFGLAGRPRTTDDGDLGVSVPWSPPETLYGTAPASERSDVYSLAATLWTLLVGRSPFELVDAENTAVRLLRRIKTQPAPPTGREDVPAALEGLLAAALAKDPAERPASALALAEGLAAIQRELGLPVTVPLVQGEPVDPDAAPDLRARPASGRWTPIQPPSGGGPSASPASPGTDVATATGVGSGTLSREGPASPAGSTPVASSRAGAGADRAQSAPAASRSAAQRELIRTSSVQRRPAAEPPRRRVRLLPILAAVLLGLALLAGVWVLARPPGTAASVTASRSGDRVTFRLAGAQAPGDAYGVRINGKEVVSTDARVVVDSARRVCAAARVLDAQGRPRGDYSPEGCA